MKGLACAFLLLAGSCLAAETNFHAAALGEPDTDAITLEWDYPVEELSTNLTFVLHSSPLPDLPRPWPVLATIPGTNTCHTLTVVKGEAYYYVTASNFWGESDPSNVASTPAPPRSGVITVRRGK